MENIFERLFRRQTEPDVAKPTEIMCYPTRHVAVIYFIGNHYKRVFVDGDDNKIKELKNWFSDEDTPVITFDVITGGGLQFARDSISYIEYTETKEG